LRGEQEDHLINLPPPSASFFINRDMSSLDSHPPSHLIISDCTPSVARGSSATETVDMALTQVEIDALRKMNEEISNMPHDKKSALVHVQRINPVLVDDRRLLDFLETESFDAKVSTNGFSATTH